MTPPGMDDAPITWSFIKVNIELNQRSLTGYGKSNYYLILNLLRDSIRNGHLERLMVIIAKYHLWQPRRDYRWSMP